MYASLILFCFCMATGNVLQVALLGTALKGELLELLLCAGDEFKLCDKLLTADWVPEDENIPDDVIDARFLASTNRRIYW